MSDIGHTALDLGGLVPAWGEAADAANAAWLASEGKWAEALMSGISCVPVVGDWIGKGGKGGKGLLKAIDAGGSLAVKAARELLQRLEKVGIENIKAVFNKLLPKSVATRLKKELDVTVQTPA